MASTPRELVIFGLRPLSELAWYLFTHDSSYRVVAFAVDEGYQTLASFHGLPVFTVTTLLDRFPPGSVSLSVPLGWRDMNGLRAAKVAELKNLGYQFATYISSRALVWQDLEIGENSMVHDGVIIQPFATVGENCNIRAGALVSHHVRIGNDCFIAARAVIAGHASVGPRCVIGLNSTIREGCKLGRRCFLGAGAVLISDAEEDGVYIGVPARRRPGTVEDLEPVR